MDTTAHRLPHRFARNLVTEQQAAQRRARTDNRITALFLAIILAMVVGYWAGQRPDTAATCDPSHNGCRFTDSGATWQTHNGVTWPVCADEDAAGPCLWDAHRDGNGTGHSFTVTNGIVTYWS